jgi:CheY-like chemotaxis protein
MDIRMPVMDGLEATQRIKRTEAGKSTVIAALTAHAMEEEREKVLAAGCDDFVRKPFREHEIFGVMGKHLGLRFEYEDNREKAVAIEPVVEIDSQRLAALPADLRGQLYKAVAELDRKRTLALIKAIKPIDAQLAGGLAVFVRNLAFEPMLDLLKKSEQPQQEDSHDRSHDSTTRSI